MNCLGQYPARRDIDRVKLTFSPFSHQALNETFHFLSKQLSELAKLVLVYGENIVVEITIQF